MFKITRLHETSLKMDQYINLAVMLATISILYEGYWLIKQGELNTVEISNMQAQYQQFEHRKRIGQQIQFYNSGLRNWSVGRNILDHKEFMVKQETYANTQH